jgi:hypothetical protein
MSELRVEWLTIREFSQRHPGISIWLIGELVRRQQLPHVRLGRRILLPENALSLLAESQQEERQVSGVDDGQWRPS